MKTSQTHDGTHLPLTPHPHPNPNPQSPQPQPQLQPPTPTPHPQPHPQQINLHLDWMVCNICPRRVQLSVYLEAGF